MEEQLPPSRETEVSGTAVEQSFRSLIEAPKNLGEILSDPDLPKQDLPGWLKELPFSLSGRTNKSLGKLIEIAQFMGERTTNPELSLWLKEKVLPGLEGIFAASRPGNRIEIIPPPKEGEDPRLIITK